MAQKPEAVLDTSVEEGAAVDDKKTPVSIAAAAAQSCVCIWGQLARRSDNAHQSRLHPNYLRCFSKRTQYVCVHFCAFPFLLHCPFSIYVSFFQRYFLPTLVCARFSIVCTCVYTCGRCYSLKRARRRGRWWAGRGRGRAVARQSAFLFWAHVLPLPRLVCFYFCLFPFRLFVVCCTLSYIERITNTCIRCWRFVFVCMRYVALQIRF